MSIRQPLERTIHTNDFRDHAFSFPVESVLKPQQGSGKLTISASAGYLLTTSFDHEPTPEQTLDHVLQPDGDRIARGTITLLSNNEPMEDSTVTISNPSGETVILTVDSTQKTSIVTQSPVLRMSTQELVFARTPVGKPTFLVLTITQQNADTPITITTDAPENFQLASDSRPAFTHSLTFVPSTTGTYVHVRYAPVKAGRTEAYLFIETPYANQFVTLTGRSTSLLPMARPKQAIRPPQPEQPAKPVSPLLGLLLTTLLAVGLLAVAYNFRCRLMPSLCEEMSRPSSTTRTIPILPSTTESATKPVSIKKPKSTPAVTTKLPDVNISGDEKANPASAEGAGNEVETVRSPEETPTKKQVSDKVDEQADLPTASDASGIQSIRKPQSRQSEVQQPRKKVEEPQVEKQPDPIPASTSESELERELNTKKPKNQ